MSQPPSWKRFGRRLASVTAGAVVMLGSTAPAVAETASLQGEFLSSQPPAVITSGTCNPDGNSTFTFRAEGTAAGPYAGTFVETGRVTIGPMDEEHQPGQFRGDILEFSATFTITSPTGSVRGTKHQPALDTQYSHGACHSAGTTGVTAFQVIANRLVYTATVHEPDGGSSTFTGSSWVNMNGYNHTPATSPSAQFREGFPTSTLVSSESDSDGVPDGTDNCPTVNNANQADIDGDGRGDVCDEPQGLAGTFLRNNMSPALDVEATCNPDGSATLIFDVTGVVDSGPYAGGTFTESGVVTIGADGKVRTVQVAFRIDAPDQGAVITGTKTWDPDAYPGEDTGTCNYYDGGEWPGRPYNSGQQHTASSGVHYEATITTAAGEFTDSGDSRLSFSYTQICSYDGGMCQSAGGAFGEQFFTSDVRPAVTDTDQDGVDDDADNCRTAANPDQRDTDGDAVGDACDDDDDGDGALDTGDNCPLVANSDQRNTDGDASGDACDGDDDGDGAADSADNCPLVPNADQRDTDGDRAGDACDPDDDGDGLDDSADNCPRAANADQRDSDFDGTGDACDAVFDNDAADITGGGWILDRKTFGLNAKYAKGAASPSGSVTYHDQSARLRLKADSIVGIAVQGAHAVIVGKGTVNGRAVSFRIDLTDGGEPGRADTFAIEWDGYAAAGNLAGGNVQVR